MSLSHCCGEILGHFSLQHCFRSLRLAGICSCTALWRSCYNIIKLRSGLWLRHCSSLVLFLRFAAVFRIIDLLHDPVSAKLCCWTDGLTFDSRILQHTEEFAVYSLTAKCPGPMVAKQWHADMLCLVCCALWLNIPTLLSTVQMMFQKSCGFVQMQICPVSLNIPRSDIGVKVLGWLLLGRKSFSHDCRCSQRWVRVTFSCLFAASSCYWALAVS